MLSHSVMSNSLWPHGLQHTRRPCPPPIPKACSNSCPSSQWCHPTTSSSVVPLSSSVQSFPASGSFSVSQFFTSGGQSIDTSVLTLLFCYIKQLSLLLCLFLEIISIPKDGKHGKFYMGDFSCDKCACSAHSFYLCLLAWDQLFTQL